MNNTFENQIQNRRIFDEDMYTQALSDLLSVLKIKKPHDKKQNVKEQIIKAIGEILIYLDKKIVKIPNNISEFDLQLEYMLKPSKTMKRRIELTKDWWKNSIGCFLASKKNGKVIAILQNEWGKYYYKNEDNKIIKINEKTAKEINTDAFCFYKSFPLTSLKVKDLLDFIIKSISKSDFIFIFLIYIILQTIGMLSPYVTKIIYDEIIPSSNLKFILPILFIMIGISFNNSIMLISKNLIAFKIQTKINTSVNSAIISRMFSLPATFFKKYSSGDLASRIGYLATFCQETFETFFLNILSAFFTIGYFFQIGYFAPSMAIPGMLMIFFSISFSIFIAFLKQKINENRIKLSSLLNSWVFSLLNGIQKIKITGSEKRAFAKWANIYSKVQYLNYSPPAIIKFSNVILTFINYSGNLLLYYFGAISNVSVSDYLAFGIAYGIISSTMMNLSDIMINFMNFKPLLKIVKPFIVEKPEDSYGKKLITSISGFIEINNISFRYSKDAPLILKNLTLKIYKGEYVAIVGKTGCGKSTILRLLLGFEKPELGAIYYDGQDINSIDLGILRQKIGVVMQNGSVFPGDIFSNIIITSPWKTMEDAWEAARIAGIEEDIKNMPMGMHTLISEGSGGISGGQKQRLMIARSIISKPSILFLDEATSALDNITQKHISNSLSKLNCTRIIIAHRLSTIKNCDRIIVLENGCIEEDGNYDDLMKKKGKFYELAIRQIM